jgi:hypothetical protein
MYRFFRKNREAVKKYLLIFFLSIVSIGMVITLAPIPTGDTSRAESNVLASVGGYSITTFPNRFVPAFRIRRWVTTRAWCRSLPRASSTTW